MFATKMFVPSVVIPVYLLLLLLSTCHCRPQIQGDGRNNNNFRTESGSQNNNRDRSNSNNAPNGGQRILEGGFRPSNFGNNIVTFPDGIARPVGGRQPQRSPFRSPSQNVADTTQGNRRPDPEPRPVPQQPTQIANNPRRPSEPARVPQRTSRPPIPPQVVLPAIQATSKFVRPNFDVLGMPLIFGEIIPEEGDILPDFRRPRPINTNVNENRRPKTTTNNNPRNELDAQRKRPISNLGPDLRPKLPTFDQPELILKATEELRSSEGNQEKQVLLPWGTVNAGILPLATESTEDQKLGFFPPFASPRQTQPK